MYAAKITSACFPLIFPPITIVCAQVAAYPSICAPKSILTTSSVFNYIVSSGEQHSVREFIEKVCKLKGFNITWSGTGLDEIGVDQSGKTIVSVSSEFYRPCEVDTLLGDCSKFKKLGWKSDYSFDELVADMVVK